MLPLPKLINRRMFFSQSCKSAFGSRSKRCLRSHVLSYDVCEARLLLASFSGEQVISTVNSPSSVFAGDVDGDGDLDVLSASKGDNKIAWYENDGSQNFTLHEISTSANGASNVFAVDVDGDGDMDALSATTYTGPHAEKCQSMSEIRLHVAGLSPHLAD